jgi:hypothetical protein
MKVEWMAEIEPASGEEHVGLGLIIYFPYSESG